MTGTGDGRVAVDVLGPLRVRDPASGADRTPPGELQRRLLALLVLERGREVSTNRAIEALWPTRPPRDPAAALQTHVFRLRQALPDGTVTSSSRGYALVGAGVDVDADRLTAAAAALDTADPTSVLSTVDDVLTLWRGRPYAELDEVDEARVEATRLEEVRAGLVEAQAAAWLALGRPAAALAAAAELADRHPLRERPVELTLDALEALGRRADALRAYDGFRRRLAEELGIEPSTLLVARHRELLDGGAARADDQGGRRQLAGGFPTHRLPLPATSLVGRDELVADALDMVGRHRLVTMLGPGGVGKTRLSLEVGHRLRSARPDRPVVFCELASADVDTAVDAVAAALGLEGRAGTGLDDRIAQVLADVDVVVVLDNCEHVLEPIAVLVDAVLSRGPTVTVIATSRERLRVAGEQLCPVPPLPLVGPGGPAERLFLERARAVRPGWTPNADERACVDEIVRRLDGLPLAIELAAARLHTLTLADIAAGLDRRFRLLASGSRTASRHQSLGAAIAWSYGLLDTTAQEVFADLSIFAGPFTIADAAAVTGLDQPAAADALATLIERSLIEGHGDGRATMLESLRAFAAEQRAASARATVVAERHAAHVLARLDEAVRGLWAPDGTTAIAAIDHALPELAAALTYLLTIGDLARAGRLVTALETYGYVRQRPDVMAWCERVLAADPRDTGPMAPSVWAVSALASWVLGDLDEMHRRAERALAVSSIRSGPTPHTVSSTMGSVALFEGRLDDALRWFGDARRYAGGDRHRNLILSITEVLALAYAGRRDEARDVSAALLADIGDTVSPLGAFAWYCAGEIDVDADPARARQCLARAVELAERTDASFVVGVAGASLASIEARVGDVAVAVAAYQRLLEHWRRAGIWSTQWPMLRSVATLLHRMGRDRDAAVLVAAVRHTSAGNRLFGMDAELMAALDEALRDTLGDRDHAAARAEGVVLDGDAAVEHALRALAG